MSFDGSVVTSDAPRDSDLTNLSWVAGAPVPIQRPVSPTRKGAASRSKPLSREESRVSLSSSSAKSVKERTLLQSPAQTWERKMYQSLPVHEKHSSHKRKGETVKKETRKEEKPKGGGEGGGGGWGEVRLRKPNCSYTSLIGLALMASERSSLPVSEIYTYIEEEFPYFKDAPEGWKNSIRHNLSLNPSFRKVQHPIHWHGKKGFFWEVNPERRAGVEREVERYLRQEGKISDPHASESAAPFPSCLHASIPSMPEQPNANMIPTNWFQFYHGTRPYYDITASIHHHYYYHPSPPPPPPALPLATTTCDMSTPTMAQTPIMVSSLLDPSQPPSQFAGYPTPSTETQSTTALLDLFGLQLPSSLPHCTVHTHADAILPSNRTQTPGMCTCTCHDGQDQAIELDEGTDGENLDSDGTRKPSDTAELSPSLSPPGGQEARQLTQESACTHSELALDSELTSDCILLEDCFEDMDCSKVCAGEFSLMLSLGGGMEDSLFEGMEEEEEEGGAELEGAEVSVGRETDSVTVVEEEIPTVVDTSSEGVECCMETSGSLSPVTVEDHLGSRQRERGMGRKGKRRRRKQHRNTAQSRRTDVQTSRLEAEGNGGGGREVGESRVDGSNMLSRVCADGEETMRDLLLLSCTPEPLSSSECDQATIDDGLFSLPHL